MSPELIQSLRRELEAIKRAQSTTSIVGAIIGVVVAIVLLTRIAIMPAPSDDSSTLVQWLGFISLTLPWFLLLASLYFAIRYKFNKRMQVLFEAILASVTPREEDRLSQSG